MIHCLCLVTSPKTDSAAPAALPLIPEEADIPTHESPLGRTYERKAAEKQASKAQWRRQAPKPDMSLATKPGFLFCQPYQALPCPELDSIKPAREPSAAARVRYVLFTTLSAFS